MKAWALPVCIAAAVLPPPASAQAPDRTWSDAELLFESSDLFVPTRMIKQAAYDDPEVRAELTRVGIPAACPAIEGLADTAIRNHQQALRRELVARIRAGFPPEALRGRVLEGLLAMNFGGRIERALAGSEPLSTLVAQTRLDSRAALARLRAAPSNWRGRFADWDFSRANGLPYRIACSIEGKPGAEKRKQVFDGFYRVRAN